MEKILKPRDVVALILKANYIRKYEMGTIEDVDPCIADRLELLVNTHTDEELAKVSDAIMLVMFGPYI